MNPDKKISGAEAAGILSGGLTGMWAGGMASDTARQRKLGSKKFLDRFKASHGAMGKKRAFIVRNGGMIGGLAGLGIAGAAVIGNRKRQELEARIDSLVTELGSGSMNKLFRVKLAKSRLIERSKDAMEEYHKTGNELLHGEAGRLFKKAKNVEQAELGKTAQQIYRHHKVGGSVTREVKLDKMAKELSPSFEDRAGYSRREWRKQKKFMAENARRARRREGVGIKPTVERAKLEGRYLQRIEALITKLS